MRITYIAASTSFDGPATTDAALAALAAEAGLIDPEPEKETIAEKEAAVLEGTETDETELDTTESHADSEESEDIGATVLASEATSIADNSAEAQPIGLFGGGTIQQKLGLKGGSKVRLGLFGGSPVGPPTIPFNYRGGLCGGSKDTPDITNNDTSGISQNNIEQGTINGTKKDDGESTLKMETDEVDVSENALDATDSGVLTHQNFDMKKVESGDALSALASAALDHSKEFKPETPQENKSQPPTDEKDIWYTVGFIKGNSFDVHNYCYCDDDTSQYTSDKLPDLSNLQRISLEPGTAYKFRVAAINSVGRGDWSEVGKKTIEIKQ